MMIYFIDTYASLGLNEFHDAWGLVLLAIIASYNGLAHIGIKLIIWTNADLSSMKHWRINSFNLT